MTLVLQDHQDLLEILGFKDQRVSKEILVLLVQLDLRVSQDQLDHLVQGVSLDQVVKQDLQERLVGYALILDTIQVCYRFW